MVLLVYFAAIYLPVLKHAIRCFELTKMNCLWHTQIFLYRFNISFPKLIRLANDVETNPGPVVFDFDASKLFVLLTHTLAFFLVKTEENNA